MSATKDKERGTWTLQFYYTDWTGARKKKKKRGFAKKAEALEWEREFLDRHSGVCNMTLGSLWELYVADLSKRLRHSTMYTKTNIVETKVLPYFKNKPINEIRPSDVRKWQTEMIEEEYLPTYLRTINNQFSAIMNYAVRFYDLPHNPVRKAGTMGSNKASTIDFWTLDEFRQVLPAIADKPRAEIALEVLYWSGLRVGELLALTPRDFYPERMGLDISKTWQVVDGVEEIGPPKTAAGNRFTTIPKPVGQKLQGYMDALYECPPDERIFQNCSKSFFAKEITRGSSSVGVKRIRVHDVRHSHVSLLINLGYNEMMIAERIGHEDVKYVTETYGHLYPDQHTGLIDHLDTLYIA